MNVSCRYFTVGTTLPWTPEATGILASFRIILHKSKTSAFHVIPGIPKPR